MVSPPPFIRANRGEPWGRPRPEVLEAAIVAVRGGAAPYPDFRGSRAFREAAARSLVRDTGWSPDPDREVRACAGSSAGLFAAVLALTAPGDRVLLPDPGWPPYRWFVEELGRRVEPWPCGDDLPEAWLPPLLEPRHGPPALLVVNSPHNPTGRVLPAAWWDSLDRVLDGFPQVTVISDEAYADIVYDVPFRSPAARPGLRDRLVVVRSLSKGHAMAGWRVGFVAAAAPLAARLGEALLVTHGFPSTPSLAAGTVALDLGPPPDVLPHLRANRQLLADALSRTDRLRWTPPEGTFYGWIDASTVNPSSRAVVADWQDRLGLGVFPGAEYGRWGEGHVRVSFALDAADVSALADRLVGGA